jgi:CHRD domain
MGLARFAALSALVFPALVACNEDNTLGLGDSPTRQQFTATMTGLKVRPNPVPTTTTAIAQITIRTPGVGEVGRQLGYAIVGTNLTSAISAHIHLGGAAIGSGPILVTLYTNPTDSVLTDPTLVTGIIPEAALPFSLDSLAALMSAGAAYVDIHATGNLAGLVRGQISRKGEEPPLDRFDAPSLIGENERPDPVETTATGSATFELLSNSTIRFNVNVTGITGVTMAHIHTAVADSAGPIAVTLFTSSDPTGPISGSLASGTFDESKIELPGVSMDSLLVLMRTGRTYVNVHTEANPNGEIRAQIEPVTTLPQ